MKLNIVVFKNLILDCFTTPVFDDHSPEDAAVQLARSLKLAAASDDEKSKLTCQQYKNLDMYVIGIFDDSTGQIDLLEAPRKLLECRKALGIVEDEQQSVSNPGQEILTGSDNN